MFEKISESLEKVKIMVVGDIILDHYLNAEVKRISPEAPVPVASVNKESYKLGGAGNVTKNIKALGAQAKLISLIGNDFEGGIVRKLLNESGLRDEDCFGFDDLKTIKKTRIVSKNQQMMRLDYENDFKPHSSHHEELYAKFASEIEKFDSILISDYGKGSLSQELIVEMIKLAKKRNKLVFIDPKPNNYLAYKEADFITPNLGEAEKMTFLHNPDFKKMGQELSEKLESTVLLTRGADGMDCFNSGEHQFHVPSFARNEVYDVTGAGDTVISSFACFISIGISRVKAAELASVAAAISLEFLGTTQVSIEQIVNFTQKNKIEKFEKEDFFAG